MSIADSITDEQLDALRAEYDADELTAALTQTLPALYGPSSGYVTAIADAFYRALPADDALPPRNVLSARDRERCLIALLTSRPEVTDLALHVYVGLMEGVSPTEIANIIFLTAIYTGVDNFARGLLTEQTTLQTLAALVDQRKAIDARSAVTQVIKAFHGH